MQAVFDQFLHFDLSVFEWVQSIQGTILDKLMVLVTYSGEAGIIFMLMAVILMFTKKHRKTGFAMIAALAVMVVCNNLILKQIFARPRPFNLVMENPELYEWWGQVYRYPNLVSMPDSYSFPSGHTSSAFAAAVAVLWYNKKIGAFTVLFAALMGFTRIYVEVHYCSDVIAGALVGVVYALLGVLITKYLYPKVEPIIDSVMLRLKGKKNNGEA